jgi:dihydrofolate reductase
MLLSAIVAMSENKVIGKNNSLPWHLPADLQHFKTITMGKPILMGRKTFESIGRPLPGRKNVVITRDTTFKAEGCVVVHSVDDALKECVNDAEVVVIGGAELFSQMLPNVKRLYLTVIHHEFDGDVFFPELNLQEWKEVKRIDNKADEKNRYDYSFIWLE